MEIKTAKQFNENLALHHIASGAPDNEAFTRLINRAKEGGEGTQEFFQKSAEVSSFLGWINDEYTKHKNNSDYPSPWNLDTTDDGWPAIYALRGNTQFIIELTNIDKKVLSSASTSKVPEADETTGFTWDGKHYRTFGLAQGQIIHDGETFTFTTVALGIVNFVAADLLLPSALSGLLSPIVSAFADAISIGLQSAITGIGDTFELMLGEFSEALEGVTMAGAVAFSVIVVIAVTSFVLNILLDFPMYHSVNLVNLTPYYLKWGVHGTSGGTVLETFPGKGTTKNDKIPAPQEIIISNLKPQTLVAQAMFGFSNKSDEWTGVEYVIHLDYYIDASYETKVGSLAILFDIPKDGQNSFYAESGISDDWDQWEDEKEGIDKVESKTYDGPEKTKVTLTYNALRGKTEGPTTDEKGYYYSSMVVLDL